MNLSTLKMRFERIEKRYGDMTNKCVDYRSLCSDLFRLCEVYRSLAAELERKGNGAWLMVVDRRVMKETNERKKLVISSATSNRKGKR